MIDCFIRASNIAPGTAGFLGTLFSILLPSRFRLVLDFAFIFFAGRNCFDCCRLRGPLLLRLASQSA